MLGRKNVLLNAVGDRLALEVQWDPFIMTSKAFDKHIIFCGRLTKRFLIVQKC